MKRAKTPTFLIELPLKLDWSNEKPLRAHLEAARCLYNALLGGATRSPETANSGGWAAR
jgi:hypothetical protein